MPKTKADIVSDVYDRLVLAYAERAQKCQVYRKDVSFIVDAFLDELRNSLAAGEAVEIRGFGTFERKLRKGKENARNLYTGDLCSTRDHYVPIFRAGGEFKKLLLENKDDNN